MLTSLLLNGKLEQAIVLATSKEAPPSAMPHGVKFLGLGEGPKPSEVNSPQQRDRRGFVGLETSDAQGVAYAEVRSEWTFEGTSPRRQ